MIHDLHRTVSILDADCRNVLNWGLHGSLCFSMLFRAFRNLHSVLFTKQTFQLLNNFNMCAKFYLVRRFCLENNTTHGAKIRKEHKSIMHRVATIKHLNTKMPTFCRYRISVYAAVIGRSNNARGWRPIYLRYVVMMWGVGGVWTRTDRGFHYRAC